jgi:hypothetical protein
MALVPAQPEVGPGCSLLWKARPVATTTWFHLVSVRRQVLALRRSAGLRRESSSGSARAVSRRATLGRMSRSIQFEVTDQTPPLKGEAKSMLSEGHKQGPRVRALLAAAYAAKRSERFAGFHPPSRIGMELTVRPRRSTDPASGDATNSLGGVGDTLQSHRVGINLAYLGELADAFLYYDDAQIREVHYREESGALSYTVRLWELD